MYRVWYSTESFADFIIDNTRLSKNKIEKHKLYESDANNPKNFHTMPDHIRKILYLDAPDLIVEVDNEPIFSIEVTTEAGTGHNAFQRFARIAAAVENNVPAIYIYPEGKIISRKAKSYSWDEINPLIFSALESVMRIYKIPALLYYFPTDEIDIYRSKPEKSPHLSSKGLIFDKKISKYAGCPDSTSIHMLNMFSALNEIIDYTEKYGVIEGRNKLSGNKIISKQRTFMNNQMIVKSDGRDESMMSPLSAVKEIPTKYLLNYLSSYESSTYSIGELLSDRETSCIYQVNAKFRGDPYPGALAAIDYLACREGITFEDRRSNLVLVWGNCIIDEENETIEIVDEKGSTITDFFNGVKSCSRHNLLVKDYDELKNEDIPRYFMQVRYGSTYSKIKHIRVYSYFADAVLFPDGALWRDA